MSLIGSLNIGKTALATHQAAIQVTSNNISNAGDPNYTRQVARTSPNPDYQLKPGMVLGTGVSLVGIDRQIDEALEERIRGNLSDNESAGVRQEWLGRVESIFNSMGKDTLSSQLIDFFNNWSTLAQQPLVTAQRELVVTKGESLANNIQRLNTGLISLRRDIDIQRNSLVLDANTLANKIAELNGQIVATEGGTGASANSLRDQRDTALKDLAKLVDVKTTLETSGAVTVSVAGEILVTGNTSRGITLKDEFDNGTHTIVLAIKADNSTLNVTTGKAGALVAVDAEIESYTAQLDMLAANLIFELNQVHSQGQGLDGYSEVTSTNDVDDANAVLNSDAAALEFKPINGSFVVNVRRKDNHGILRSEAISVDLDGLGADETLNSLAAKLNGISGVSATVMGGKIKIEATSKGDTEVTFGTDSSHVLAALGINSFFNGTDASSIAINANVKSNSSLVAAAGSKNGASANNTTALEIAALQKKPLTDLGDLSVLDSYDAMISKIAVSAASAKTNAEATEAIQDTLNTQREALSGVSIDEEAINLMREQRAYQAAARVVAAIDELMKTLLQLV